MRHWASWLMHLLLLAGAVFKEWWLGHDDTSRHRIHCKGLIKFDEQQQGNTAVMNNDSNKQLMWWVVVSMSREQLSQTNLSCHHGYQTLLFQEVSVPMYPLPTSNKHNNRKLKIKRNKTCFALFQSMLRQPMSTCNNICASTGMETAAMVLFCFGSFSVDSACDSQSEASNTAALLSGVQSCQQRWQSALSVPNNEIWHPNLNNEPCNDLLNDESSSQWNQQIDVSQICDVALCQSLQNLTMDQRSKLRLLCWKQSSCAKCRRIPRWIHCVCQPVHWSNVTTTAIAKSKDCLWFLSIQRKCFSAEPEVAKWWHRDCPVRLSLATRMMRVMRLACQHSHTESMSDYLISVS